MSPTLSILDLAFVAPGEPAGSALSKTVALAQLAERLDFARVWYAEHHNIPMIASSATSVLIAHVAAHTKKIRLGAGGIMLPNHSPLVIAEQFGTLACLHPDRIDLGLGRAPGTDPTTSRALRVDPMASDAFPDDVLELQGFLGDVSLVPGVEATPGKGTNVPLYILGSSLFGARLAAKLGLPYAFASHFAPQALEEAVAIYRRSFQPSKQLEKPYVIAGLNVIAADTEEEAQSYFEIVQRQRARALLAKGRTLTDEEVDLILETPSGLAIRAMARYSAVGTTSDVATYVSRFAARANADEIMTVHPSPSVEARLRSVELLARAKELLDTEAKSEAS